MGTVIVKDFPGKNFESPVMKKKILGGHGHPPNQPNTMRSSISTTLQNYHNPTEYPPCTHVQKTILTLTFV